MLRILLLLIAAFVVLSTAIQMIVLYLKDFALRDLIASLLYVDSERSLPTLYSTAALLAAALLGAAIAHGRRREGAPDVRYWVGLSLIFSVLGIDEFAAVHERSIQPIREFLDIEGGPLWYAWVIPAIVLVGLFVVVFIRFLGHLPRSTRRGLWIAGFLFVGGAVGVEMLSASVAADRSRTDATYVLIVHLEEALEMLGIAVLLFTLLSYIPIGLPDARWTAWIEASHREQQPQHRAEGP